MRATLNSQRELLILVRLDQKIGQIQHRLSALPEEEQLAQAKHSAQQATDFAAEVSMRIEDLHREITRCTADITAVRQREERDEELLKSGTLNARTQVDVQHELSSLPKRRKTLEADLRQLHEREKAELTALHEAQEKKEAAHVLLKASTDALQVAHDTLHSEYETAQEERAQRTQGIPGELITLYERLRQRGVAAGVLEGRRCGACRMELTMLEVSQLTAAQVDDVQRCPECEAILVRAER